MKYEEYRGYDAVGLAELVAKREVGAAELLDAALARIDEVNLAINAVVRPLEAEARAAIAAGLPEGPLAGVPFLLKDLSAHMKGVPTSAGSRLFADFVPEQDSAVVAAYRRAGLVICGKSNSPELGLAATTEPVLWGPSRNPWNPGRTTGGSSGGAAAAVAAGIVPAASASDGGGSIRTPSSCCGVFGMKPSRGRVSFAPFAGEGWGGLSQLHAVTRSVRDSAVLLDIGSEPQPGDPYWAPPPFQPFSAEVGKDPGRLRIAFSTESLTWGAMEPECAAAVRDAAALCQSLGHNVEEVTPPGDFVEMAGALNALVSANVQRTIDVEAARRGAPIRRDELEALTWVVYEDSKAKSAADYADAMHKVHAFGRTFSAIFEKYDVLMLSTLGRLPYALGVMDTNAADLSAYAETLYSFMPNTQPFNASGTPAMSVPLGWSADGLPIGIQFGAKNGGEAMLYRLAGQLEQARPWAQKQPTEAALRAKVEA